MPRNSVSREGNWRADKTPAKVMGRSVVLPPDGVAVRGAEAIRELLKSMFDSGYSEGKFQQSQVEYSGNMAVEVGDYTVLMHAEGGMRQDTGRYMATWRRQENGEFRITVNVWSTN